MALGVGSMFGFQFSQDFGCVIAGAYIQLFVLVYIFGIFSILLPIFIFNMQTIIDMIERMFEGTNCYCCESSGGSNETRRGSLYNEEKEGTT